MKKIAFVLLAAVVPAGVLLLPNQHTTDTATRIAGAMSLAAAVIFAALAFERKASTLLRIGRALIAIGVTGLALHDLQAGRVAILEATWTWILLSGLALTIGAMWRARQITVTSPP